MILTNRITGWKVTGASRFVAGGNEYLCRDPILDRVSRKNSGPFRKTRIFYRSEWLLSTGARRNLNARLKSGSEWRKGLVFTAENPNERFTWTALRRNKSRKPLKPPTTLDRSNGNT